MSTTKKYFSGNSKVPAEKSSFVKTYNRLSLFLKEKGNLSDLGIDANFDVIGKSERSSEPATTTVDLLSRMENPIEKSTETETLIVDLLSKIGSPIEKSTITEESTSPVPQCISLESFFRLDDCTNKTASSKPIAERPETLSKTEQMTIFYGGQVMVFDCVSADKAREMMLAAGSASRNNQNQNRVQLASCSNSSSEAFGSQHLLPGLQGNGLDLPIARRVSLHKFLEKRKDRATGRAPYQLHNPSSTMATASLNHKFDLNL